MDGSVLPESETEKLIEKIRACELQTHTPHTNCF